MLALGYLALVFTAGWKALHPTWLAERPEMTQQRIRWLAIISALALGLVPAIILRLLADELLPGLVIVILGAAGAICYLAGAMLWTSKLAMRLRLAGTILISTGLSVPTILTPLLILVVPLVLTTEQTRDNKDRRAARPLNLLKR